MCANKLHTFFTRFLGCGKVAWFIANFLPVFAMRYDRYSPQLWNVVTKKKRVALNTRKISHSPINSALFKGIYNHLTTLQHHQVTPSNIRIIKASYNFKSSIRMYFT